MPCQRLNDLDRAKGLAIFLVVLGHLTLASPPKGNEWYILLQSLVYRFHMPFFMFISGFIMYYSFPKIKSLEDYLQYIKKKFIRLMPAFFLFSVIIIAGKIFIQPFMHVDNAPVGVAIGILKIITRPTDSSARSLWFIYVLFCYYLIFPPLIVMARERLILLVSLGLAIQVCYLADLITTTPYFAIYLIVRYFFVFSVGVFLAANIERYNEILDKDKHMFFFLFLFSFSILFFNPKNALAQLVIGFFSIPALHALVRSPLLIDSKFLSMLGKYTFPIYLMNILAIGFVKGVIQMFMSWDGQNFIFVSPILLVCGIFLPIFVKRYIFSRIKTLDFITG